MAKQLRSTRFYIRDAMDHAMAVMMGKTPKKPLIIEGEMRPRKQMLFWLKLWNKQKMQGPIPKYVQDNGTWFEGRANVRDYPCAVYWRRKHKPQPGECFKNARKFCMARPNARYFEGFYCIFESPQDHAWVVMEDGRVLDFTHEAVIQKLKNEKAEVHVRPPLYLGVEVPHEKLAELDAAVEPNKPLLELYKNSLKRRPK